MYSSQAYGTTPESVSRESLDSVPKLMNAASPGVEGIKALSQGLGDGPRLSPVEEDWEDVSPVEVHLGSCVNMGPPDTLFKEAEALSCNRDVSQYLSLTSPRRVRSASQGR